MHTIQNTKAEANQNNGAQALDGEDFFNKAQSQPQSSSFSLSKAPKWLERPAGVSFGFGGKVVSFNSVDLGNSARGSKVEITEFAVDSKIGEMTEGFAQSMTAKDLMGVCEARITNATTDAEKTDWKVIETLIADNPRKELISYLGFSASPDDTVDSAASSTTKEKGPDKLSVSQTDGSDSKNRNRLSAFFDSGNDGDNFLADLASTKGAKTNNPFHMYSDLEPEVDKKIIRALMLGQFDNAMEICLKEDRLSDAFMIATCGGQSSIDKVQKAYFERQSSGPKYLRLLASVVGKNLWDVVYNADLENWKEVMATLCTYASIDEFPDLCEALGDRLEERSSANDTNSNLKANASFCYIAGSKLEKVVGVWITELEHNERMALQATTSDSSFSVHARALQNFIEKVTVFREVTHYQDKDRTAAADWKLAPLYEKYTEYADIVAAHGQLSIAENYLDLLPSHYPAAEVARNRVKQATRKSAGQQNTRQPMNTSSLAQRPPTNVPTFESQPAPGFNQVPGPYAPGTMTQPQGPYAPQVTGPYGVPNYQNTQTQQPPGRHIIPPPPSFGAPVQAPPQHPSPAVQPASKQQNMPNWNDTPEDFFKPPTSRRGTPAVQTAATSAPFYNQSTTSSTPPTSHQPFGLQSRTTSSVPPPPRGPAAPPRAVTPQTNQVYHQAERPSSSAANMYAPPVPNQTQQPQHQPQIPRGPSPYNAPPSGPPRDLGSRYAPAPITQQAAPPNQMQRPPPPPNPFATRQSFTGPQDITLNQGSSSSTFGSPQGLPPQSEMPSQQPQRRQTKPPTPKYRE